MCTLQLPEMTSLLDSNSAKMLVAAAVCATLVYYAYNRNAHYPQTARTYPFQTPNVRTAQPVISPTPEVGPSPRPKFAYKSTFDPPTAIRSRLSPEFHACLQSDDSMRKCCRSGGPVYLNLLSDAGSGWKQYHPLNRTPDCFRRLCATARAVGYPQPGCCDKLSFSDTDP